MHLRFSLETIGSIDNGKMALLVNKAIAQVVDDMQQRPGDKSKRSVTLVIDFTPASDQEGTLESVAVEFGCTIKVPPRRSRPYAMEPHAGSRSLHFNDAAPENPRQKTLDEVEDGD